MSWERARAAFVRTGDRHNAPRPWAVLVSLCSSNVCFSATFRAKVPPSQVRAATNVEVSAGGLSPCIQDPLYFGVVLVARGVGLCTLGGWSELGGLATGSFWVVASGARFEPSIGSARRTPTGAWRRAVCPCPSWCIAFTATDPVKDSATKRSPTPTTNNAPPRNLIRSP